MRSLIIFVLVILAGLLSGCSEEGRQSNIYRTEPGQYTASSQNSVSTKTILIVDSEFIPDNVTISRGMTVVWINQDEEEYTVDSDKGNVDSEEISEGDSYAVTFNSSGTYSYHSDEHPSMSGTIIVE